MEITFLGTGTSNGVPQIGCKCKVCTSEDKKNKRYRSSIAITNDFGRVIIDTTQEFRLQCIREDIRTLNAVLYTHHHADHILGLDDVRAFTEMTNKKLPIYGSRETLEVIKQAFSYLFKKPINKSPVALIEIHEIYNEPFNLINTDFTPIPVKHGRIECLAYKFNNVVYCTDCNKIPKESEKYFYDLDLLILDALRYSPHPTHFSLNQAIKTIEKYKPKKAIFTHMTHNFDYDEITNILPDGIMLAYDGLKINL